MGFFLVVNFYGVGSCKNYLIITFGLGYLLWLGYYFLLSPLSWQRQKEGDSPSAKPILILQRNIFSHSGHIKYVEMPLSPSSKHRLEEELQSQQQRLQLLLQCGMPFTLQLLTLIIQSPFCHMLFQGKFLCRLSSPDPLAETFYK